MILKRSTRSYNIIEYNSKIQFYPQNLLYKFSICKYPLPSPPSAPSPPLTPFFYFNLYCYFTASSSEVDVDP